MGLLSWIILGLLAAMMMKNHLDILDIVDNITVGMLGGIVGGCLAAMLLRLNHPLQDFNLFSSIISFVGAVLLIAVIRAFPEARPSEPLSGKVGRTRSTANPPQGQG